MSLFVLCALFLRRSLDSRLPPGFTMSSLPYFSSSRSLVAGSEGNARGLVVRSSSIYFVVIALLVGFGKGGCDRIARAFEATNT